MAERSRREGAFYECVAAALETEGWKAGIRAVGRGNAGRLRRGLRRAKGGPLTTQAVPADIITTHDGGHGTAPPLQRTAVLSAAARHDGVGVA